MKYHNSNSIGVKATWYYLKELQIINSIIAKNSDNKIISNTVFLETEILLIDKKSLMEKSGEW